MKQFTFVLMVHLLSRDMIYLFVIINVPHCRLGLPCWVRIIWRPCELPSTVISVYVIGGMVRSILLLDVHNKCIKSLNFQMFYDVSVKCNAVLGTD